MNQPDGWQTAAVRDGCFQRVRATGTPIYLPTDLQIKPTGIELSYSQPLDVATATDINNWRIEQWNYRWTEEYGSEHYFISDPERFGHDPVPINRIELSADGKTVHLSTAKLRPVMQMRINADLRAIDGTVVPCDIYNTIHAVPK